MRIPIAVLIHLVQVLVAKLTGDPEYRPFLEEARLSLDRISEGNGLVSEAQGEVPRVEAAQKAQVGITQALLDIFAAVGGMVTSFRISVIDVFQDRPRVLARLGLRRRTREKPKQATVAGQPKPKHGVGPWRTPEGLVAHARKLIGRALDSPDVLAAMEPYGFSRGWLEGVLPRIQELERLGREQESAKKTTRAAQKAAAKAARALHRWYMPWRKRLTRVLHARPDLRAQIGLPA